MSSGYLNMRGSQITNSSGLTIAGNIVNTNCSFDEIVENEQGDAITVQFFPSDFLVKVVVGKNPTKKRQMVYLQFDNVVEASGMFWFLCGTCNYQEIINAISEADNGKEVLERFYKRS